MRSRKYTRRIEVWQKTVVSDGYGGNITEPELIAKSWCMITTPKGKQAEYLNSIGITDTSNSIIVGLRHRNDLNYNAINQFLKYKNDKYIIKSITNSDLNDVDIQIVAIKEQTNSIEIIDPINV